MIRSDRIAFTYMYYSVIIPVYNASTTLCRCLDSLVCQLPRQAEVLVINDGSTDDSLSICEQYAAQYPQIVLFSKENGGVSSARNLGLDHAKGEYVLFLDSDDALNERYFERLGQVLRKKPEMLLFGLEILEHQKQYSAGTEAIYQGSEKCARHLAKVLRRQELNLITTKAFRRDIIEENGIRFDERLDIGEDKVFSFSYALHVRHLCVISDILYRLSTEATGSLSRKKRDDLYSSVLLEHRLMSEALEKAQISKAEKSIYNRAVQYSYYRSAYTVCKKSQQNGPRSAQSRETTAGILREYSRNREFRPAGIRCRCAAFPVRMQWNRTVNNIITFFLKEESK